MKKTILIMVLLTGCIEYGDIIWLNSDENALAYVCASNGDILHCGTGFFVDEDKIVTAYHVVDDIVDNNHFYIYKGQNKKQLIQRAKLSRINLYGDLALIKLDNHKSTSWFNICDDNVRWNDKIFIVSYDDTVVDINQGRVKRANLYNQKGWIITTATGSVGYSGGPILNTENDCVTGVVATGNNNSTAGPGTKILRDFVER